MKPLTELVKEWREYAKLTAACGSVTSGISAESLIRCAEELQAWLREADEWTWREADREGTVCVSDILSDLLGTTRTEGEK